MIDKLIGFLLKRKYIKTILIINYQRIEELAFKTKLYY